MIWLGLLDLGDWDYWGDAMHGLARGNRTEAGVSTQKRLQR